MWLSSLNIFEENQFYEIKNHTHAKKVGHTSKFMFILKKIGLLGTIYFKKDWITGSTIYRLFNTINHAEGVSCKEVCVPFRLVRFIF